MTKPKAKLRKTETDKDGNIPATCADNKSADNACNNSSPAAASPKNTATAWFTAEIQAMMHGFGDCSKPLIESAKLIEEIVHQQMNSLLIQLAEIASNHNVRFIGIEDIIFLLRKDKVKLSRLFRYLSIKDLRTSGSIKGAEEVVEETVDGSVGTHGSGDGAKVGSPMKKRMKVCHDFISQIDQTGELLALFEEEPFDEVKHERDLRADLQTQSMDMSQYLEFAEARRSSFARKYRSTKFRDWILKDNVTDIKPNTGALEILNYLAYETVAQIVDLTLLVKQDANARADDPTSKTLTQCFNPDYPSVRLHHVTKSVPSVGSTPPESPRFTSPPVSPTPTTSGGQGSHSTGTPKSKSKKRKKSGNQINLETPYSQMIHPADIREAVRRYWQPIGPMVPFSKFGTNTFGKRLLCC